MISFLFLYAISGFQAEFMSKFFQDFTPIMLLLLIINDGVWLNIFFGKK